jgi:hypothetical protein
LSTRKRISNKFRIIDIWKNEMNEKEFLIKLKSVQIIFSLIEVLRRAMTKKYASKSIDDWGFDVY